MTFDSLDWGLVGKGVLAVVGFLMFLAGVFFFMVRRLYKANDTLFQKDTKTNERIDGVDKRVRTLEIHAASTGDKTMVKRIMDAGNK